MSQNEEDRPQNTVMRQEFMGLVESQFHETAATAIASQVKAMVEARCVVAMKVGRSWPNIRTAINQQIKDPDFCAEALYAKPIGKTPDGFQTMTKREQLIAAPSSWPRGFSIRFIEAVLAEAGHFDIKAYVTWEDESKRITDVTVYDIFKNNIYQRTVITPKTVERKKKPKDEADILGQRLNSWGDAVYTVAALPAEVDLAEASGVSKAIRTMGERLIPPQYKREWEEKIEATLRDATAADPEKEKKRVMDAFFQFGVTPADLEEFLGHSISALQPAEYGALRGILVLISQGEATWRDVLEYEKHARDNDHDLSEGAKRVQEKVSKQNEQKSKMDQQAKEAREAADKAKPAEPKKEPEQPKAETKAAEPETTAHSAPSNQGEKQEATTFKGWQNRAAMLEDFAPLMRELGERESWKILGANSISEDAELAPDQQETIDAFEALRAAVAEKRKTAAPTFGNKGRTR